MNRHIESSNMARYKVEIYFCHPNWVTTYYVTEISEHHAVERAMSRAEHNLEIVNTTQRSDGFEFAIDFHGYVEIFRSNMHDYSSAVEDALSEAAVRLVPRAVIQIVPQE